MAPELDDDVSEIHTTCPFCSGEYVMTGAVIRHSVPACEKFESSTGHAFRDDAIQEERRRRAHATH